MNKGGLLKCDKCLGKVVIVDTRLMPEKKDELYRRRTYKCTECGWRFETLEKIRGKGIRSWQGPV